MCRHPTGHTKTIEYWRSPGIPVPGGVIAERELTTWIDWLVRNGELKEGELKATDLYTNELIDKLREDDAY